MYDISNLLKIVELKNGRKQNSSFYAELALQNNNSSRQICYCNISQKMIIYVTPPQTHKQYFKNLFEPLVT